MEHNSFYLEKAEPVPGSFHTSFIPHVGSFHSPTWGYQRHNSYRVAMPYSTFMIQYSTNCKIIFRLFIPHIGSFHSPTWGYQRQNSYRVAMPHNAFIMQYSANRKTIFRLFIPHLGSFYSPTWSFQRHDSYRVAMLVRVILRRKVV